MNGSNNIKYTYPQKYISKFTFNKNYFEFLKNLQKKLFIAVPAG